MSEVIKSHFLVNFIITSNVLKAVLPKKRKVQTFSVNIQASEVQVISLVFPAALYLPITPFFNVTVQSASNPPFPPNPECLLCSPSSWKSAAEISMPCCSCRFAARLIYLFQMRSRMQPRCGRAPLAEEQDPAQTSRGSRAGTGVGPWIREHFTDLSGSFAQFSVIKEGHLEYPKGGIFNHSGTRGRCSDTPSPPFTYQLGGCGEHELSPCSDMHIPAPSGG